MVPTKYNVCTMAIPFYANHSTGLTIRYCSKDNCWAISSGTVAEKYVAFAEARGTKHPGYLDLTWHVWEPSSNQHVVVDAIRTTTAPASVQISGRVATKENYRVVGVYHMVCVHNGRPAYQNTTPHNKQCMIRYLPSEDRWLLDASGLGANGNMVNGFADANGAEHPGLQSLAWHIWETEVGSHVKDGNVVCKALENLMIAADARMLQAPSSNTTGCKRLATDGDCVRTSKSQATEHKVSRVPMPFGINLGLPKLPSFLGSRRGGGA